MIVGDDGRVRVLDFGLAHFFGSAGEEREGMKALPAAAEITDVLLTQTGAVLGTPAYMAAEQFAGGRGDAKTDQFSFCTALYEALYGQRPFAGDKLDTLASAVQGGRVHPVKARHDVPQWLHRVVARGLQPDPASRWPSMDALLVALSPPEARVRWGRVAGFTGAACTLLIGGIGYAFMLESPPPSSPPPLAVGQDEAAAQGQAALMRSNDAKVLVEARAALTSDPLQTIRLLSMLGGDDPATWQRARFLANAAEVRGLPAQVLRAFARLSSVWPLADGGLVGRDEYGAVWRWNMPEGTVWEVFPAGAATQMVVARDVPVWAVISRRTVQVLGADRAQTIDIGESIHGDWRLAADGRTLMASAQTSANTSAWVSTVYLWDLTRPGSPPQTITPAPETFVVIADDASIVLVPEAKGIRVKRPREGAEKLLKYRGTPSALSADGRFVIAEPADRDGVMDVLEIETGKSRRVEAESVTVLGAADVLFTRMEHGRPFVRRESLATGAVVWRLPLPGQAASRESKLVVDPGHEQFAVAIGEAWGIGDLRRGELTSFVTLPKGSTPQWAGDGALMVVVDNEVRIYRPSASPVQVRGRGSGCGLSPGGRWAVTLPWRVEDAAYTRIDRTTNTTTTFRCPSTPKTNDGEFFTAGVNAEVDDTGQVILSTMDGWSCWWDEQHGARTGKASASGWHVGLPRGVALGERAEVEVWSGPEDRTQRWTAAGPVLDLVASPSGTSLAVRSERGVQVLHVDTGEVMAVPTWATPAGKAEVHASALAWSPDGARLAVLDKIEASLELSVWDVVGEPREVGPSNHVVLGGHVLEDSPGRPRNRMTFTPAGTAVALTHRHESLLLVDLATHATKRLDVPELFDIQMRSETDAIGIDVDNVPVMIDFAAWEVSPLAPNLAQGGSTRPPMRRGEHGSVYTCAALGPGTLIEIAAVDGSSPQALRGRLLDLVASL